MRIAINGFGRIGRLILRLALLSKKQDSQLACVAINDVHAPRTLAHLFKYDSIHSIFPGPVTYEKNALVIDHQKIAFSAEPDPGRLPWKKLAVDLVLECSGRFTSRELAKKHLDAGAKKVIISAPCKESDLTIVMGVNENQYDAKKHHLISNASCTTNCLGVVAKVLRDAVGIKSAFMTTVHSYTNDQRVLDDAHSDLRRARASALSMIPTTSGATKTLVKIFPELKDAFEGLSVRVPTPDVSLLDFVAEVKKPVTADEVNRLFEKASHGGLKRYLGYSTEPLVSADYIGDQRSAIVDAAFTQVIDHHWVKMIAWYDNEVGFAARMIDLARYICGHELY